MKLIHNFILVSVLILCPAYLQADTSAATDAVQSDDMKASADPQILPEKNEVAQKTEEPLIAMNQYSGTEEKKAQEATPAEGEYDAGVEEEAAQIPDPFAPFNKLMFEVNDKFYFWMLKPVTQVYSHIIPEDFRVGLSSVYDNLWAPSRVLNNLLQLRLKAAGNELIRFLFNSFAGIGGLSDVAKDALGIKRQEADFGQTLGHYGIGHGFYLVLPVFGPSSLRDGAGLVGDRLMHPLTYVGSSHLTFRQQVGIASHELVNDTSFRIGDYESFKEAAIDPYVSMRDAFVQHRKKKVEESKQ